MQEQSPLRPAEFAKIRDGFIAFLKQPAETPLQAIIPADVLDAMASTARRGRKRRWWLDFVRLASVLIDGIDSETRAQASLVARLRVIGIGADRGDWHSPYHRPRPHQT